MDTFKKVISVGLLVVLSIVTAVIAGAGLAIWDAGEKVSTVYSMAFEGESNEPIIKDTQTVVIQDVKLSDVASDTPSALKQKNTETSVNLSEQLATDVAQKDPNNFSDELSNEPFSGALNAKKDNTETTGETEEADSAIEEETEQVEEEKPQIVLTSEISGITNIVSALDGERLQPEAQTTIYPGAAEVNYVATAGDPNFPNPVTDFPREFTEVDLSYFDDALFIGDSRMQGLGMYSKTNATFYAATAFQLFQYVTFKVVPTANGKVPIFDAMQYDQFTKVYIKVGLNELGCVSDEKFLEVYQSFIDRIRAMQPRAIIYIHAVLPVTASKSQTDRTHCNEKITARNESLKAFAQMNNCYYVDVSEEFVDETGALRSELTSDGIHMAGRYMTDWIDALRRRAVKWP